VYIDENQIEITDALEMLQKEHINCGCSVANLCINLCVGFFLFFEQKMLNRYSYYGLCTVRTVQNFELTTGWLQEKKR